jgi:hypothetical protein
MGDWMFVDDDIDILSNQMGRCDSSILVLECEEGVLSTHVDRFE